MAPHSFRVGDRVALRRTFRGDTRTAGIVIATPGSLVLVRWTDWHQGHSGFPLGTPEYDPEHVDDNYFCVPETLVLTAYTEVMEL